MKEADVLNMAEAFIRERVGQDAVAEWRRCVGVVKKMEDAREQQSADAKRAVYEEQMKYLNAAAQQSVNLPLRKDWHKQLTTISFPDEPTKSIFSKIWDGI